jgi:hypothetical protein
VYRAELEQFVKKLAKKLGKKFAKNSNNTLLNKPDFQLVWWMVNGFAPARFLMTSTKKIGSDSAVSVATLCKHTARTIRELRIKT